MAALYLSICFYLPIIVPRYGGFIQQRRRRCERSGTSLRWKKKKWAKWHVCSSADVERERERERARERERDTHLHTQEHKNTLTSLYLACFPLSLSPPPPLALSLWVCARPAGTKLRKHVRIVGQFSHFCDIMSHMRLIFSVLCHMYVCVYVACGTYMGTRPSATQSERGASVYV